MSKKHKCVLVVVTVCLIFFHCAVSLFASIYPNPPIEGAELTAVIPWSKDIFYTAYEWSVNGKKAAEGICPETFRLSFENRFTPVRGDLPIDSTGADITSGRFSHGVHIGEAYTHLAYSASDNVSADSGSVSLWFSLDFDLDNPIYDKWNRFFEYRMDNVNALYIEINKDGNYLTGVSQSQGEYTGTWYQADLIKAKEWHHLVWTWDAGRGIQNLYLDGLLIAGDQNYVPPEGEAEEFLIGCAYWEGPNAYATMDEFRLFNRSLEDFEVRALYQYPDKSIDAVLSPDVFLTGDQIEFSYRYYNGTGWSQNYDMGTFTVIANPISRTNLNNDVLPASTQSVPFSVSTTVPAACRCDTVNLPFNEMGFMMEGQGTTHHQMTLYPKTDHPYAWTIRCAPDSASDNPWPVSRTLNMRRLRDYNPSYPRIFALWRGYDSETDSPSDIAKFDLLIGTPPAEAVFEARRMNPDCKVLTTYNFSYGNPEAEIFEAAAADPSNPLYNCVVCDPDGSVLYEGYWGHSMYNLTNPVCVDYIASRILNRWQNDCLTFDGMYFDRVQGNIFWMWNETSEDRNIDIDRDGIGDDNYKIETAWQAGVMDLLERIREKAPNAIICGNDAIYRYGPWMHGRLFEMGLNHISAGWSPFRPFIEEYIGWRDVHREPWALPLMTGQGPDWLWSVYGTNPWITCPADTVQWVQEQYDRMRFGLCAALMGDGLYSYDFGTTWWGHDWWYDEFDADLGKPLNNGYATNEGRTILWEDHFEDGTFGHFYTPTWSGAETEITTDPDEVITGAYSLKADNDNPASIWNEFAWSDTNQVSFQPETRYTVSWKYRILREAAEGYFYAICRTWIGDDLHDIWGASWDPETGTMDSTTGTFQTDSLTGYYLIFGMKNDGAIVIDDIVVELGGEPVWRRDFSNGLALVNPSSDTISVSLEKPFQAISGVQNPSVNNGALIQELLLPPWDGRILLNVTDSQIKQMTQIKKPDWAIYPNPCNAKTTIRFILSQSEFVQLNIYDILGRRVRQLGKKCFSSGRHEIQWDGLNTDNHICGSGLYLIRLLTDQSIQTKKIMVLK